MHAVFYAIRAEVVFQHPPILKLWSANLLQLLHIVFTLSWTGWEPPSIIWILDWRHLATRSSHLRYP